MSSPDMSLVEVEVYFRLNFAKKKTVQIRDTSPSSNPTAEMSCAG